MRGEIFGFMLIAVDIILEGLKDYFLAFADSDKLEFRGDEVLKDIGISIE
ncbi:MAG TPA: hypothetical protein PLZ15_14115 [Melioribacteraceae bacterium]|nr:hypothetical protein [Melioribacteraceae bacterium]